MQTYRFNCVPPNERSRVVEITAATQVEATQRANALWCHQTRPPYLLSVTEAPLMLAGESAATCSICRHVGDHSLSCPTRWYR